MFTVNLRRNKYLVLGIALWAGLCVILYRSYLGPDSSGSWGSAVPGPNGELFAPIYVDKLPKGPPRALPRLQFDFPAETAEAAEVREGRRRLVKERFQQTWQTYRDRAFGADEVRPISGESITTFGGWGATLIDSLDALWIMGMKDEFEEAVLRAARVDFNHTQVDLINVFETTIRYMGGFLGAYDISGGQYSILLQKADEVGELLYRAFDTPNRMPITRWHLHESRQKASSFALIAEIGSLTMEFTRLSQLTGKGKYYDAVYRVAKVMEENQDKTHIPGLWPIIVDAENLDFSYHQFSLGGMADSAFEYLPKMHALLGGNEHIFQKCYERAVKAARRHLFYRPMLPGGEDILLAGSAELSSGRLQLEPQGQHLTCFVGGMVAMGAKLFMHDDEMVVAHKLTDGCIWAYDSMPTGIMPEVFHMSPCMNADHCPWDEDAWTNYVLLRQPKTEETQHMGDSERLQYIMTTQRLVQGYTTYDDPRYILRPEAIESVFLLYRMTGEAKYMDAAWRMFQAIDRHTKTELAHSGISNVAVEHPQKDDKMESFWLAETLKYFYLIFSEPEVMSLDRYVVNTEAHPFLRPGADWKESIPA